MAAACLAQCLADTHPRCARAGYDRESTARSPGFTMVDRRGFRGRDRRRAVARGSMERWLVCPVARSATPVDNCPAVPEPEQRQRGGLSRRRDHHRSDRRTLERPGQLRDRAGHRLFVQGHRADGGAVHQHPAAADRPRGKLPLRVDPRRTRSASLRRWRISMSGCRSPEAAGPRGTVRRLLVVFENYPADGAGAGASPPDSGSAGDDGRDATHYPLALIVRRATSCGCGSTTGRTCSSAAASRRSGSPGAAAGGRGHAMPRPIGSLAILAADERATILEGWNDTAQPVARRAAGAVRRASRTNPGRHRGGVRRALAELRGARRPRQPAGAAAAELGVGPETWSGCAWSARSRWWWGCSDPQGRRGLSAARSGLPAGALAFMLADAAHSMLVTQPALLKDCPSLPRPIRHSSAARRRPHRYRGETHHAPRPSRRPPPPRLRHLHLGLYRNAQGRHGGRTCALSNFSSARWCEAVLADHLRDRLLAVTTIGFDIACVGTLSAAAASAPASRSTSARHHRQRPATAAIASQSPRTPRHRDAAATPTLLAVDLAERGR